MAKNYRNTKMLQALGKYFLAVLVCCTAFAGSVTKPYTFVSGDIVSSTQLNSEFDTLFNEINSKETRMSALESSVSLLGNFGKFAILTMPVGTVVPANWAQLDPSPLEEVGNTLGSLISVGATSVTINSNGDYRVQISSADSSCNAKVSAFELTLYLNGVELGQNSVSCDHICAGSTYEWVGSFSAGDVISIAARQGDVTTKTVTSAIQKRVRLALFIL